MATVTQDFTCTGTATPIVQQTPSKIQNIISTAIPSVTKRPAKIQSATGTASVRLLKVPQKVLMGVAISTPVIALIRFGVDTFDIVQVKLKWFVSQSEGWIVRGIRRFGVMVRGKPGGYWN